MSRFKYVLALLPVLLTSLAASAADSGLQNGILDIQHAWAHVHYQVPADKQDADFVHVEEMADALVQQYPARAEPLVWKAIVLGTHAGAKGGLGALGMVREARSLLEKAETIEPDTLDGSIYTTLGSLYYQVPGWPLAYGDKDKARAYLQKALKINPDGIDANYFYGDFLYRQGRYSEALSALKRAMQAAPRPDRPLADAGRRREIQGIIDKIRSVS